MNELRITCYQEKLGGATVEKENNGREKDRHEKKIIGMIAKIDP